MPKPRGPWWHDRDRAYYTRIDGKQVALRHADGTKVAPGDDRGARAAVARLLDERDERHRRAASPTVLDLCRDYLKAMAAELEADTLYGKEWILTKWCEFGEPPHGTRPAREIDSADLHRMRKAWERRGLSAGSIRRLYREVKACWAWAARPEPERATPIILEKDPIAGMRMPTVARGKRKYIPGAVIRRLVAFAEARAARMTPLRGRFERQAILLLRFLAGSGCRPKEACGALWSELDDECRVLTLTRHKTKKKTGMDRIILVPAGVVADLIALRNSGHAHPTHLFAHPRSRGETTLAADRETGVPWGRPGYTAWFKRLVREAVAVGLDVPPEISLYWLRHSYLTDAQIEVGAERAADLAGNTKEIARGTYYHAQLEEMKETARRVEKRRSGGETP